MLGLDGLLLALLWHEHLRPAAMPFALGSLLTMLCTIQAWWHGLRRLWLTWRVHQVFGASIDHLRPVPLARSYRLLSALGDVLIALTLLLTQQPWLAAGYTGAALLVHGLLCWHARPPARTGSA